MYILYNAFLFMVDIFIWLLFLVDATISEPSDADAFVDKGLPVAYAITSTLKVR